MLPVFLYLSHGNYYHICLTFIFLRVFYLPDFFQHNSFLKLTYFYFTAKNILSINYQDKRAYKVLLMPESSGKLLFFNDLSFVKLLSIKTIVVSVINIFTSPTRLSTFINF